jgi:hypothetical protein
VGNRLEFNPVILIVASLAEMAKERPIERPLRTWKEIASYLRVSVRTAQNWERDKGLPVRRVLGDKSQVRAVLEELDQWTRDQELSRPTSARGSPGDPVKASPGPRIFIRHLAGCCLLYAALYVFDLFLETAYKFDQFGRPALLFAPILMTWIAAVSGFGLWAGWRLSAKSRKGSFAILFGSFALGSFVAYAVATVVLPSEPVTAMRFAAQTARAAFLKNAALYFLPLATITWLIPFHFVARLHRVYQTSGPAGATALLSGQPSALRHSEAVYFRPNWLLWGMLASSTLSVFLTQDMLGNTIPGPHANLFMTLALSKTFCWCCLGMLSVFWYARALREFPDPHREDSWAPTPSSAGGPPL